MTDSTYPDTAYTSNSGTVFGSPRERDDIARIERGINDTIDKATKHFESVVDKLAPRAIGSTKSSPEEAFREYLLTIAGSPDPVAAGESWVQDRAKSVGLPKALSDFLDMVTQNEKRLQSFQEGDKRV